MSQRTDRLGELFREEIGKAIKTELKDPRIGFVTVTRVEVSSDTRHADVHLSILGTEEEMKKSLEGIKSARGHLRTVIGQRVRLKNTPELKFHLDTSAEYSMKISKLIHRMHKKEED